MQFFVFMFITISNTNMYKHIILIDNRIVEIKCSLGVKTILRKMLNFTH